MNITLKSIKHNEVLSEETHCFSATVYLNGKKVFGIKNAGHGGEDEIFDVAGGASDIDDMYHTINKHLGKEKCQAPYETMDNCLEFVVADLVNTWLTDKEIKKVLRKIVYMDGNQMRTVSKKPTEENFVRCKKQSWWNNTNVILNTMPIEEVRQYFN